MRSAGRPATSPAAARRHYKVLSIRSVSKLNSGQCSNPPRVCYASIVMAQQHSPRFAAQQPQGFPPRQAAPMAYHPMGGAGAGGGRFLSPHSPRSLGISLAHHQQHVPPQQPQQPQQHAPHPHHQQPPLPHAHPHPHAHPRALAQPSAGPAGAGPWAPVQQHVSNVLNGLTQGGHFQQMDQFDMQHVHQVSFVAFCGILCRLCWQATVFSFRAFGKRAGFHIYNYTTRFALINS
jgi:hypothetical protein